LSSIIADSVVVITGASQGMGRELAMRYARRGCKMVISARKFEELQKVEL
jgi:short-subunit dehydrogenase